MENKRICTYCQTIKSYDDFHWHKKYNIPFSRCKTCYNKRCAEYRKSTQGKQTHKQWSFSDKGKEVKRKAMKRWRTKNAIKRMAHTAVSNAIRDKRLFRLPCIKCGNIKAQAHHTSYDKDQWLNITWLCKLHHDEITFSN